LIEWPDSGVTERRGCYGLVQIPVWPRIGRFDAILRDSGYTISEHADFNPHSIFDLHQFEELNTQLTVLATKKQIVQATIAAHDRDVVDDLWGD
jgi:hypothetical protein